MLVRNQKRWETTVIFVILFIFIHRDSDMVCLIRFFYDTPYMCKESQDSSIIADDLLIDACDQKRSVRSVCSVIL